MPPCFFRGGGGVRARTGVATFIRSYTYTVCGALFSQKHSVVVFVVWFAMAACVYVCVCELGTVERDPYLAFYREKQLPPVG